MVVLTSNFSLMNEAEHMGQKLKIHLYLFSVQYLLIFCPFYRKNFYTVKISICYLWHELLSMTCIVFICLFFSILPYLLLLLFKIVCGYVYCFFFLLIYGFEMILKNILWRQNSQDFSLNFLLVLLWFYFLYI